MYMTVKQASEKWGISDRRTRVLCSEGKIPGAYQEGRGWKIPVDAKKPADGRYKSKESLLAQIDRKKVELDSRRPLTAGEAARLNEEFIVEYTYNSNAIEGNTLTLRETDLVLRGLTIDQKPLKDHMEAVGHKEAFDFMSELVKDNVPISESPASSAARVTALSTGCVVCSLRKTTSAAMPAFASSRIVSCCSFTSCFMPANEVSTILPLLPLHLTASSAVAASMTETAFTR